jgi:hypothetical protein
MKIKFSVKESKQLEELELKSDYEKVFHVLIIKLSNN